MLHGVMADWFYGKDNTQHGPVSEQEIRNLAASGQIDTSTIVWREGMGDWVPMSEVPEFQALTSATSPAQATPESQAASPYNSPQTYAGQQPYQGVIPTDGLSIAALVCGILAVITCYVGGLFGLPAVICGHMSLKKIKNSPTAVAGKGMAIAGLVTGYIGIAMTIFFVLIMIIGIASEAM